MCRSDGERCLPQHTGVQKQMEQRAQLTQLSPSFILGCTAGSVGHVAPAHARTTGDGEQCLTTKIVATMSGPQHPILVTYLQTHDVKAQYLADRPSNPCSEATLHGEFQHCRLSSTPGQYVVFFRLSPHKHCLYNSPADRPYSCANSWLQTYHMYTCLLPQHTCIISST